VPRVLRRGFDLLWLANSAGISVATRVGRQIQQKVLAHEWREIDRLRPAQLGVHGKCRHLNLVHKFFQTRYAPQFHRLRQRSTRPQRPARNTQVDIVMERSSATNSFLLQFRNRAVLIPFEMQTFRWNLFQVNFHSRNLSEFID